MFAGLADAITRKLKDNNAIDDEHYEICRYGIKEGLSIILNIVTTIAIGIACGMLWQALLFTLLYIPLRSNAGGYHASSVTRCYFYSILMMIAVLFAIKHIAIPSFICVIALTISIIVISANAPVEDLNKPLDDKEQIVYRKRTLIVIMVESFLWLLTAIMEYTQINLCITWVFLIMSVILLMGKCKKRIYFDYFSIHRVTERKRK